MIDHGVAFGERRQANERPARAGIGAPDIHVARRWALYQAASPLFQRHGYRDVTVHAIAHACSLMPSSLYHYFESKLAFALFPLTDGAGWCQILADRLEPDGDGRAQLGAFIDALAGRSVELRLALRLAREIGAEADARTAGAVVETIHRARRDLAGLLLEAAPGLGERSEDLSEALLLILTGDLPGVERSSEAVRRQMREAAATALASSTPVEPRPVQ